MATTDNSDYMISVNARKLAEKLANDKIREVYGEVHTVTPHINSVYEVWLDHYLALVLNHRDL